MTHAEVNRDYILRGTLLLFDILAASVSYAAALWLRFDGKFSMIPASYMQYYLGYLPLHVILTVLLLMGLGMYRGIWRFAGVSEMLRSVSACAVSAVLHAVITIAIGHRMPVSYYIFGGILMTCAVTGIRASSRVLYLLMNARNNHGDRNVMVIGAGNAGRMIVSELLRSRQLCQNVKCIIDDAPVNKGKILSGIPIVGGREEIFHAVEKYKIDQIIFAIPTATAAQKRDILNICKETSCELKILPGIYQLIKDEVTLEKLRAVDVNDLLGREPIRVNNAEVGEYLRGRTVMVTGGGGSIGSELCRQIAGHEPKELIIFDIYENNAYDIQQELLKNYPKLKLTVLIGSVRDNTRIRKVFEEYRPEVVYHAAAHKHVPLMEVSPNEAIKNNVLGTWQTARAAADYGCRRFVLISTDKAVNPTSLMGATKRICEMIIQTLASEKNGCEFVAVRFGNVLGSNGSVIPLFRKQIEAGGPVTVTHPDIVRYFMTIPEAVSLVIQAGAYAKGGEIFVLDMGEPVKIVDLAKNLIRLSGYTPGADIKIEFTGLRPGEKLYEEKLMAEEGLQKTKNNLIFIGKPMHFEEEKLWGELRELIGAAQREVPDIEARVAKLLGGAYTPRVPEMEKSSAAAGAEPENNQIGQSKGRNTDVTVGVYTTVTNEQIMI